MVLKRLSDSKSKLHNIDIPRSVGLSSEPLEISLRHALIKFLNTIDYSFTSYPESKDLELAVRNEILSFGIDLRPQWEADLRPQWEARLRTSCALVGMAYIKHPIEIQFSIAVCNPFSFPNWHPWLILVHTRSSLGSVSLWMTAQIKKTRVRSLHSSTDTSHANHKSIPFSTILLHISTRYGGIIIP